MALCTALRSHSEVAVTIDFIGSGSELERQLVEANGLRYHTVRSGKLRRYGRGVAEIFDVRTITANTRDAWKFSRGLSDARKLLRALQPDVVFVKGGYVGLPVGLAARRLKLPLVIHESDTVMGLTNRLLAPSASIVATGFPIDNFEHIKIAAQIIPTGNPIRKELLRGDRRNALKHFAVDSSLPTLLFIGGSQGAQAINEAVFQALSNLVESYNIIHQTGEKDIDAAMFQRQRLMESYRKRYIPRVFLQAELADAYALADIVITRCGANVLAELAALKKPIIVIPLPTSANNHQLRNAQFLLQRGAARLLEQSKLTPLSLRATIDRLAESENDQKYLGSSLHRLAINDAAERLAEVIINLGKDHG